MKNNILKLGVVILIFSMFLVFTMYVKRNEQFDNTRYVAVYDTTDHMYLSDIDYEKDKTFVEPGYYLRLDKSNASTLLTLNVPTEENPQGVKRVFLKGISAWATSEIVYDLDKLSNHYDYFTAYLGVDLSQISNYYNGGVTFYIYTSNDGVEWKQEYQSKSIKNTAEDNLGLAEFVKINIKDKKYLKLYAYENGNSWYSQWYDDAIYADAMLITEDYKPNTKQYDLIKEVSYYDNLIKKDYEKCSQDKCNTTEQNNYELNIMRRNFVSNVGYDILQALLNYSNEYNDILTWLLNDKENLELFLLGGTPDGNYISALKVLNELYIKYHNDFTNTTALKTNPNRTLGDLYKEMAITLSLTHSANVGLWVTGAPENPLDPNGSYAIDRYAIYKKLYNDNKLKNEIFENISVEEMRFVMNNIIDDEEIMWLNEFAKDNNSTDPYHYINYTFDYDYSKSEYYDINNKDTYDNKIRFNLERPYSFTKNYIDANGKNYNVTYGDKAKLWIVFEEGSVCGGLSKTGSNLVGVSGVPSSVVSQPGHAAYIYMNLDKQNNKVWTLYNDVSGWGQSGKTEKLSVRMPNGWGSGSYASGFPASYVLLAQGALNDYKNYVKSEKVLMLSAVYKNDYETLNSIYNKALEIQNINFDAWYGLVNLYKAKNATSTEYIALARRITEAYKYYPLPMYDLLNLIEKEVKDSASKGQIIDLIDKTLEIAKDMPDTASIQAGQQRQVANYLLNSQTDVATFSFDGENANKIVLSSKFDGNDVKWQYNVLDSANEEDWKYATGLTHELTKEEIALIHPETDIHIRLEGAREVIYDINIEQNNAPLNVIANDNENTLLNTKDEMEWKVEGTNDWTLFKDEQPDLKGDKTLAIRYGYTQNKIPSTELTFEFTDNLSNLESVYVSTQELSIDAVSTEEVKRENNAAKNVLDGNINTMWHTLWDGTDTEKYITIALENPRYISALEYVPRANGTNGNVTKLQVLVSMDGVNFEEVALDNDTWANDNKAKKVNFKEAKNAKYVKLVGVNTVGNYMSASMINLFEDTTKRPKPTAEIEYSTTKLTNGNVLAYLKNPSTNITITNNEGASIYTFEKNGEFTFEFEDEYKNKGTVTAKVDWIDKEVPVGSLQYSETNKTTKPVTVTLTSNEDITITNNGGKNTYTFKENGEFTFEFKDKAGNTNELKAKVDWITKEEAKNTSDKENNNPSKDLASNTNTNTNSNSNSNNNSNNSNNTTNNNVNSNNNSSNNNSSNNSSSNNNTTNEDKNTDNNSDNNSDNNVTTPNDNNSNNNQNNSSNTTNEIVEEQGLSNLEKILIASGVIAISLGLGYVGYTLLGKKRK